MQSADRPLLLQTGYRERQGLLAIVVVYYDTSGPGQTRLRRPLNACLLPSGLRDHGQIGSLSRLALAEDISAEYSHE